MRDINSFVSDNGLIPLRVNTRAKSISPLLKGLSQRSVNEIKSIIENASLRSQGGDRTLEGWADIILKKPHTSDEK
jgi:hypothetical protein